MADALSNHYWIQSLLIIKVSLEFPSIERKQQVFLHNPLKSFFLSINSYEVMMLMLSRDSHVSLFIHCVLLLWITEPGVDCSLHWYVTLFTMGTIAL